MDKEYYLKYINRTHMLGRVCSAVTVILLVGAPFLMGLVVGAVPDLGAVARGFLSVGLVWTVSSVVEFLVYTPMLILSGIVTGLFTGICAQLLTGRLGHLVKKDGGS